MAAFTFVHLGSMVALHILNHPLEQLSHLILSPQNAFLGLAGALQFVGTHHVDRLLVVFVRWPAGCMT